MSTQFHGHEERECGEHRTTGQRAWCHDCSEWCYPEVPCKGCELPRLRVEIEHLRRLIKAYLAVPEDDDAAEAHAYNALVDAVREEVA